MEDFRGMLINKYNNLRDKFLNMEDFRGMWLKDPKK